MVDQVSDQDRGVVELTGFAAHQGLHEECHGVHVGTLGNAELVGPAFAVRQLGLGAGGDRPA